VLEDHGQAAGPRDACHLGGEAGALGDRDVVEDAAREDEVEARVLERERHAVVRDVLDAGVALRCALHHLGRDVEPDDAREIVLQVLVDQPDPRADVERHEPRRVAEQTPREVDEAPRLHLVVETRVLPAEGDRALERALVRALAVPVELGH
jgi:hypothetical protein